MKLFFLILFKIFLILTILAGCAATEKINETDSDEQLNQGIALLEEGQYDRAIAYFNKAIELNPRDADAYNNRGLAYFEGKGQYDKAIVDYNKAIELNPRSAAAYNNRGLAYGYKGKYDKAISDCNKAIELNPRSAAAYNNRGLSYFNKRDYEKAWDDVHKAQNLGYKIHPGLLKALRQASGRQE